MFVRLCVYLCVCLCVCVFFFFVCVCVCLCETERDRDRQRDRDSMKRENRGESTSVLSGTSFNTGSRLPDRSTIRRVTTFV